MEKRKKTRLSVATTILLIVLIMYVVSLIIPLFWAFMTSFKDRSDYLTNTLGFPNEWNFGNYLVVIQNFKRTFMLVTGPKTVYIEGMLLYSVLYAVGGGFLLTASPCIVSYCCAKFPRFKVSKVLVTFVIVSMSLPIVGSQAAELQMLRDIGLYDSIFGCYVLKSYFTGTYFLVFLATFSAIPKDFAEAAYIDGAGNFTVFFKLTLPLVSKTFMTIMLIQFINLWNDYQVPLLYMPTHPTLAYGLYSIANTRSGELNYVPMKMCACMILFIPIFIIFIAFQKQLIGNISMGGLKE